MGRARIAVEDTGIGIAPEDQERVFEEFVRVGDPVASQKKGSGFSLAVTRRYAKALGGSLSVKSHPGAGSTFELVIPVLGLPTPSSGQPRIDAEAENGSRSP
jgi:signal transduction histidine kinase